MGVSYEEAVKAQQQIEDKLLQDPNVVSIGVVAELDKLGQPTGDYAIQVGVISVENFRRAKKHGESLIPSEYLLFSEKDAQKKSVHISVIKEGKIETLSQPSTFDESDFPTAIDDLAGMSISELSNSYVTRSRPAPCGYSIGHPDISAGTLGLLLEYTEGSDAGKAYILSNNHVIAANNAAYVHDPIIQPGAHDTGVPGRDTIALLHRWVPLSYTGTNYVDAAIAEVCGGSGWSRFVTPHISRVGMPGELADGKIGMYVEKVGRTTGYTQGQVDAINYTIKINYPVGILTFKNQIRTTNMSRPGDSGSCILEQGTKSPVGLLFAGSESATFCNPIKTVLSSLSMFHINHYPSGKSHAFLETPPLTVLRRSYSTAVLPSSSFSSSEILAKRVLSDSVRKGSLPIRLGALLAGFGIYATTRYGKPDMFIERHHSTTPIFFK